MEHIGVCGDNGKMETTGILLGFSGVDREYIPFCLGLGVADAGIFRPFYVNYHILQGELRGILCGQLLGSKSSFATQHHVSKKVRPHP